MARNTQLYNVTVGTEVQQVVTLKEVKALLGDNTITTKGIIAGEYADLVTLADMAEEQSTGLTIEEIAEATGKIEVIMVGDAPKDGVLTNTEDEVGESTTLTNAPVEDTTPPPTESDTEYPEVGHFETDKAMKKYIKGLSDNELKEWCELEGAVYNANDHQSINRMRMAMAIKGIHFPDTVAKGGSTKKKAKYADFSTEDLVQMAIDNDIEVRDDKGDLRILRMYTIMALKEAGLLQA
jgi:hypothetical protein